MVVRPKPVLLSTGSTLLNLCLSGRPEGGLPLGHYYFFVGDSASGKTWLAMSLFAEACQDQHFVGHRLIYDNAEDGALMDVPRLFGAEAARRIEPPARDGKLPSYSETVEDFYYHVDDAAGRGRPFVYVLDSMDALTSADDDRKFDEQKRASRSGRDTPGSYGVSKARRNSEGIRRALRGLRETGSILVVVSQTRDSISGPWGETRTRSGGRALRFYSTTEVWTAVAGRITRDVRGKKRTVGHRIRLDVKKNRITGRLATVEVPIYPGYGIDDAGSCVDWLVAEGIWTTKGGRIFRPENKQGTRRDDVIRDLEASPGELRATVARAWADVERDASLTGRRPRYV